MGKYLNPGNSGFTSIWNVGGVQVPVDPMDSPPTWSASGIGMMC